MIFEKLKTGNYYESAHLEKYKRILPHIYKLYYIAIENWEQQRSQEKLMGQILKLRKT